MTEFTATYQPPTEALAKAGKRRKIMTEALVLALHREASNSDGKPTKQLNLIADQLVKRALEGDVVAIREVFDRAEGKVPTPVGGTDELPPLSGLTVTFVKPA